MRLFDKKRLKVSKAYAVKAAQYRRNCMGHMLKSKDDEMFSLDNLRELYIYESTGKCERCVSEMKRLNGYWIGKWLRDLNITQMKEGITSGDFFCWEFIDTPFKSFLYRKALADVEIPVDAFMEWYKLYHS